MDEFEELINNVGDISSAPDMFHPDYGWIILDNKTTEEGLEYFKDQIDKLNPHMRTGNC